jgi:hypothetical protein
MAERIFKGHIGELVGVDHVPSADFKRLEARVAELERLWKIALKNPELIRELAAEALRVDTE